MKKINVKRRKWRKKHHEAETVNQKGGGQKHRQMEMWIKLQRQGGSAIHEGQTKMMLWGEKRGGDTQTVNAVNGKRG